MTYAGAHSDCWLVALGVVFEPPSSRGYGGPRLISQKRKGGGVAGPAPSAWWVGTRCPQALPLKLCLLMTYRRSLCSNKNRLLRKVQIGWCLRPCVSWPWVQHDPTACEQGNLWSNRDQSGTCLGSSQGVGLMQVCCLAGTW